MGIFTRVRDIVSSNINAALDKAEDPEKLVKHMIREMEDTLIELKAACAGSMATAKKSRRQADAAELQVEHWAQRAELAVDRGREHLAREALRAKRQYQDEVESILRETDQMEDLVGQYKSDIVQIEEKLGTARERQRVLVRRYVHAVTKKRAEQQIRKFDSSQAIVRFEEFTQRLDRAEADAELVNYGRPAHTTLEGEFRDIERDESIEDELANLKEAKNRRETNDRREEAVAVMA